MKTLALAFLLVCPLAAFAQRESAPERPSDGGAAPRATLAVPDILGPGTVTTLSNVRMKVTNIGVMGNAFRTTSDDPSAQWPGPSGVEYLYYWALWVGGVDPTAERAEDRYRVSSSIEWRPPSLEPFDRIYTTADGTPRGFRGVDDDGDGKVDEDPLNGRDDDGDGAVDEDYAALSDRMFAFTMRDDTPQSFSGTGVEPHRPLGLKVEQSVLQFGSPDAVDFVPVQYVITNVSAQPIDSVFVGFLVDQDVGPVSREGYWRDDVPEPGIPSRIYDEPVLPGDLRYVPFNVDAVEPNDGYCTHTTHSVYGFTMTDDDGDGGATRGASCFFLLGNTWDTPFFHGPPFDAGFNAFHLYRPGIPAAQGGTPTIDIERYRALSVSEGVDAGMPAVERPGIAGRGDWSALASVGPYERLLPGQSITITVAFGVWPVDANQPRDLPSDRRLPNPKRYEAMFRGTEQAALLYRGQFQKPPAGTPTPQQIGRETLIGPLPFDTEVVDCHYTTAFGVPIPRLHRAGTLYWYDFNCLQCSPPPSGNRPYVNCEQCDAVPGYLRWSWVVPATPPSPQLQITPGVHEVRLAWDNRSEVIPDHTGTVLFPQKGRFSFWGYRVYRAAGYTRPTGTNGPADDQWELLAELRHFDRYEPLVDSVDTDGDGRRDKAIRTADVLFDRATGQRYPAADLVPLIDPATRDTVFATGVRTYFDQDCRCNRDLNAYRVASYPIGRYSWTDRDVHDGFTYFYAVTGLDSSGAAGVDGSTGSLILREGRKVAVEADAVVPHAAIATDGDGGVIVVPNPYRGHAQWDLNPSPSDPTGAHVDFLHMPAGAWMLRIYTIAGDLVTTIRPDDVQSNGRPQRETPDDGQASWNLLSRNGQDIVSGIYLFSVEAPGYSTRGKFVVIR